MFFVSVAIPVSFKNVNFTGTTSCCVEYMLDVHSSEAAEACSYVTLCLVNYFCSAVFDIKVITKHKLKVYDDEIGGFYVVYESL